MKTKSSLLIALLVAGIATLTGCAGSGATTGTGGPSPFQGAYQSNIGLDNGKSGALTLNVAADASATGTLKVTVPPAKVSRAPFSFTAGDISVSGNVNADGTFTLTGSDPISGGFGISGNLPTTGNGTGSIEVSAGGATYTSTIGVSQGGGSGSLTFSNSTAAINSAAFPTNPYVLMATVAGASSVVAIPSITDNSRSFQFGLGPDEQAGTTVTFSANSHMFGYSERSNDAVDWYATSGTMKIVSRTANTFEIQLVNAVFTSPDTTGSFTVNGTLKK